MNCWLARFSEQPCDGQLIRAHLIPKQRIKREWMRRDVRVMASPKDKLALELAIWDQRVWVPACGGPMGNAGHHGAFDSKQLYVPRWALPPGVEEYAREYGLVWSLDRDYGVAEEVA
jgi:hypothetical protein